MILPFFIEIFYVKGILIIFKCHIIIYGIGHHKKKAP